MEKKFILFNWLWLCYIVLVSAAVSYHAATIFVRPQHEVTTIVEYLIVDIKQTCEELGGEYSYNISYYGSTYSRFSLQNGSCTKDNVRYEWSQENERYETKELKVLTK